MDCLSVYVIVVMCYVEFGIKQSNYVFHMLNEYYGDIIRLVTNKYMGAASKHIYSIDM